VSHSITPEEYARIIAEVYDPDLDWDKPIDYDLLDRDILIENARSQLGRLMWAGFVVQRLDDLVLDEFDLPARDAARSQQ
jgi:hypothetical protein